MSDLNHIVRLKNKKINHQYYIFKTVVLVSYDLVNRQRWDEAFHELHKYEEMWLGSGRLGSIKYRSIPSWFWGHYIYGLCPKRLVNLYPDPFTSPKCEPDFYSDFCQR